MIHLKSIELQNFKGISQLRCELDDLTVLAGRNNAGKTSVLQAIYLLMAAVPRVAEHGNILHSDQSVRHIALNEALPTLGMKDNDWLSSRHASDVNGTIIGCFGNGLRLELGIIRNSRAQFFFTVSHPTISFVGENIQQFIRPLQKLSAAILSPPGEVPSREQMVNGDQYQDMLRDGKGAQLWRNSIWWGIQADGFESFNPVQSRIQQYFPEVDLLLPTLGSQGTPEILIKYRERGNGPLDIAQSGAGLRTFVSLARVLEQSPASVLLLDEPDSHLHASQQGVIVDLLLDAASVGGRQVILASHSPEVLSRVPTESIRWFERGSAIAAGGQELSRILEHLGVSADRFTPRSKLPEILVYVEGVEDRPIIESLINWCRRKSSVELPSTLVIPHRDGRFDGRTLQGIARFTKEMKSDTRVIGIRDLDWYYSELPVDAPIIEAGTGWTLLTLQCKELENLICDPGLLHSIYEGSVSQEEIEQLIDQETANPELVEEWCYQVRPRIRDRLPHSLDPSTRERTADEMFTAWRSDPKTRRRLVGGKSLLRRIRHSLREIHGRSFYPRRVFERLRRLPTGFDAVAKSIFPTLEDN